MIINFARPRIERQLHEDLLFGGLQYKNGIYSPKRGIVSVPERIIYRDTVIPWDKVPVEWIPLLPWQAAISIGNLTSVDGSFNTTGDAVTFSFDSGSPTNGVILIHVIWRNAGGHTVADTAVTYNGVQLTSAGATSSGTASAHHLWYLAAPAAGSNTVSVDPSTGSTAADCIITVVIFSGVDQTTPCDGYNVTSGTDSTIEGSCSSAVNDVPVFFGGARCSAPTGVASDGNYTERWDNVNNQLIASGGEGTGTASFSCVGTISAGAITEWRGMTINLNVASAGGIVGPLIRGRLTSSHLIGGRLVA